MSADSRYSPWASTIAVPPPKQQRCLRMTSTSSVSSTRAIRWWCSRSNKQHPRALLVFQTLDEGPLGGRESTLIDIAPVALVEAERFCRLELGIVLQLPGELLELRISAPRVPMN